MRFTLFGWVLIGEWRAHPWRVLLSVVAIATGVALGFCVHLVNGSAISSFNDALNTVSGQADLEIVAREAGGFDEKLYPLVAGLKEVEVAAPSVEVNVAVAGQLQTLHVLGIDLLAARQINGVMASLATFPEHNASLFDGDTVFLHPTQLAVLHKNVGDEIAVIVEGNTVLLKIGGVLPSSDQHLAVMDIATAQWRLKRLGRLSRIAVKRSAATSPEALQRALAAILPADAAIVLPGQSQTRADRLSRAYRVNLDMLALMALFTGGFLVYSTQSLSVMRRRGQAALLRVLGQSRRQTMFQILLEGAILGAVGSILGLAGGALGAALLLHWFGGDLGGGYFQGGTLGFRFAPAAAATFFALGTAAALAGSWLPARSAQTILPMAALKSRDEAIDPSERPPIRNAVLLLAAGALLLALPSISGLPIAAYVAMGLFLLATIAAMPAMVRLMVIAMLRIMPNAGLASDLALRRLHAAPSQGTIALCGIVASASLMVAMATMVASFRGSVDEWVEQVLPADLYLHVTGPATSYVLDQADQLALQHVEGVVHVDFLNTVSVQLESDRPALTLLVRDYEGDRPRGLPVLTQSKVQQSALSNAWISEASADLYAWRVGQIVTLPLEDINGAAVALQVFVKGIWRDYARQNGAVIIDAREYLKGTGQSGRSDAAFDLNHGVNPSVVAEHLRASLPEALRDHVEIAAPGEIRRTSLAIFDRSFTITYLLEAVAIGIGLAGVAATFSAQTIARAKEFGMLRHLGVMRGEILRMLGLEGVTLGLIGVLAGFALGLLQGQILIRVVNPQSFHWTMETHVPWRLLAGIAVAILAASAGTALIAGRGAVSGAAIHAVREDW